MRDGVLPELLHRSRREHLLPLVRAVPLARGGQLAERACGEHGRKFRALLKHEDYLFTGGVYSPLDARIAGMKSI